MSVRQKQKVLITGSNGLLGQKLVALLAKEENITLWATSRGANRLPYTEGYHYCEADLTVEQQVEALIGSLQPDIVIHTAAMTHVDVCEKDKEGCWQSNVYAVQYLVKACEKQSVFFVHLSTDFVFDGENGPYREEDAPNPVNFYGWSKLAAERIVQQSTLSWAIVRTVLVYGVAHDMSRSNLVLWVKKSLEEGKTIQVVADQYRTPTLAEDLAEGCWKIAKSKSRGIWHVSSNDYLSPYEMAITVAELCGLDHEKIIKVTADTFQEAVKRPPKTGFVIDKLIDKIQFKPSGFKEGLVRFFSK